MTITVKTAPSAALISEGNYSSTISVYGYDFYVSFVEGELIIRGDSGAYDRRPAWQKKGAAKMVREFATKQIEDLGEGFMIEHRKLYEMEA